MLIIQSNPAAATPPNINPKFPSIKLPIPFKSAAFLGFAKNLKVQLKVFHPIIANKESKNSLKIYPYRFYHFINT